MTVRDVGAVLRDGSEEGYTGMLFINQKAPRECVSSSGIV